MPGEEEDSASLDGVKKRRKKRRERNRERPARIGRDRPWSRWDFSAGRKEAAASTGDARRRGWLYAHSERALRRRAGAGNVEDACWRPSSRPSPSSPPPSLPIHGVIAPLPRVPAAHIRQLFLAFLALAPVRRPDDPVQTLLAAKPLPNKTCTCALLPLQLPTPTQTRTPALALPLLSRATQRGDRLGASVGVNELWSRTLHPPVPAFARPASCLSWDTHTSPSTVYAHSVPSRITNNPRPAFLFAFRTRSGAILTRRTFFPAPAGHSCPYLDLLPSIHHSLPPIFTTDPTSSFS